VAFPRNRPESCSPLGGRHPLFQVHAQPVGDAVDVIEESDDLRRVIDRPVGQPLSPKPVDVGLAHQPGCSRQLDGVVTQGAIDPVERGRSVILFHRIDETLILDLDPEVIRMGLDSVVTVIGTRDDHREHLPLGAGQRRFGAHGGGIKIEHRL